MNNITIGALIFNSDNFRMADDKFACEMRSWEFKNNNVRPNVKNAELSLVDAAACSKEDARP